MMLPKAVLTRTVASSTMMGYYRLQTIVSSEMQGQHSLTLRLRSCFGHGHHVLASSVA
jgi:hypothetical protein